MPFSIVRDDITHLQVDAIVNAANERLWQGGGVCGAIFAAAGARELQAACDEIGHCPTGGAVATPAFALPARHVIHAVGPVWHGGHAGEEVALRSCYRRSLELALELGDSSIAFPLISSGIYGYPKEQAIDVAIDEIRTFLQQHDLDVRLVLFDIEAMRTIRGRFGDVTERINDVYAREYPYRYRANWEPDAGWMAPEGASADDTATFDFPRERREESAPMAAPAPTGAKPRGSGPRFGAARRSDERADDRKSLIGKLLKHLDASFSTTLLRMIDERGLKDSEVYRRANMSRQHFSKIRSNPRYKPKKQTVLALAVALELSLDDTRMLLERAGFALTHAEERDVIVEFFIEQGTYDIYEINLALYAFDQPLLG